MYGSDLRKLQEEMSVWGQINAPESTLETTLEHIKEEVLELELEIAHLRHDRHNTIGVECADIVILLAQMANLAGFDLAQEIAGKWTIVEGRRYERGEDGVYRHVPDGTR